MSLETIEKMPKIVFVFPGQGSQIVGMGADFARQFAAAKEVFQEVDEALQQNLSQIMFSGVMEELTQTQNAQPAIMAVSMAIVRVLEKEMGFPLHKLARAVAGHSLGEYTALCAADVLTLSQTAKLLKARGAAMAKACQKVRGGMLALLGATPEQAVEIAQQTGVYVANDNAPGQIVLSGTVEKIDQAKAMAEQLGIRRALPLSVAGAFHSPLMQSAADEMQSVLGATQFKSPKMPVFFNVTAQSDGNIQDFAQLLARQIVAPVRWRELVKQTQASYFVECGVGNVLAGLIKRTVPGAEVLSIASIEDVQKFLDSLAQ